MTTMTATPPRTQARTFDQLVQSASVEALRDFLRLARARFVRTPTAPLGYAIEVTRRELFDRASS